MCSFNSYVPLYETQSWNLNIIVCTASNITSYDPHTRCLTVVLCTVAIATVVIAMHLYKDHTIILIIIVITVYSRRHARTCRTDSEIHTSKYTIS